MTARRAGAIALWGALLAVAAWKLVPRGGEGRPDERAGAPPAGDPGPPGEAAPPGGGGEDPGPAAARVPPAPVRMRASAGAAAAPASASLAETFAAEERDPEWAAEREAEVARRAGEVLAAAAGEGGAPARAGAVECRARTCRLAVSAGDPGDLARALEWLGGERGFYRFADDMVVVPRDRGEGGPRSLELYLRFSR
ncbi:MAG TPA: hypothetical protein VKZ63_04370 [Kofleriaceae bacterium]|nr:hypothetical protein [Kofleriaceae bacterium]